MGQNQQEDVSMNAFQAKMNFLPYSLIFIFLLHD